MLKIPGIMHRRVRCLSFLFHVLALLGWKLVLMDAGRLTCAVDSSSF
jgi:hypothetical protein